MGNLKRNLTAGFFFVAVLGTLWHFIYSWTGCNRLIGYIAPVNESTYEHMKLLFFPALFYLPAGHWYLKENYPSFTESFACGILTGTWSIPVFFYSYSGILGKNINWIDIAIFYIAVLITFCITYRLTNSGREHSRFWIWLLLIMAVSFFYFTYHPADLGIFNLPSLECLFQL